MLGFEILGPVEVVGPGGPLPLGGQKQRALLAVLLLHANEIVPTERLIDDLWGEDAPRTAIASLQNLVSQLRRLVGADRLQTRPPGYVLRVEEHELDLARFERLVAEARAADGAERAWTFRRALELWRGPPLADMTYETFAQNEIRRLEELRVTAIEDRIEADLALGAHAELVHELEALAAQHPLRERVRRLLMLALYRSGRQAEALETYQATRRELVDELGLEPSSALQELERAILRQDASLDLPIVAAQPVEIAAAPPAPVERERRKPVTVVFCDLEDSTALAERLDPEPLRRVLGRYFDVAARVFERHGGTLEKFIGDAVVAVFGVPTVHEDDALRAARAALELRAALTDLNVELESELGLSLALQIGINSGVVVAGDPTTRQSFVTGDVVNVAARLEQVAAPDEILLGQATWQLVRDAVVAEQVAPLELRGRSRATQAFRLLGLADGGRAPGRRLDAPLVGREQELARLRREFVRCVEEQACRLVTVVGTAGIGKSRLATEAQLQLSGEAHVLVGRCLPYGEGITFSPVREMLAQALGEDLDGGLARALAAHPDREWIASSVAGLFGPGGGGLEQTFLALRRLLEHLAHERPLVLVLEDVHWAEPVLLDLVEHLAEFAADAPIFVLCLARPDLLEQRPGWASATTIVLERLRAAESEQLAVWLVGAETLSDEARALALRLAEGNPLFLEQLLTFATEEPAREGEPPLPPTIEALLAARLDRLGPAERILLDRAAIVGAEFDVATLAELVPDALGPTLPAHMAALVRKELVRRDPGRGGAYRFRHVLIRDAAYRSIAKGERAELHARVAERLTGDAIVGYHLEQAYRCRVDVGAAGPETDALALQASERLESAAAAALARSDLPAAIGLFARAAAPPPVGDLRRARLLAELAAALMNAGRLADAGRALDDATASAAAARELAVECRVLVEHQFLKLHQATVGGMDEAPNVVRRVVPVFERAGDERGLCRAWQVQATAHWLEARAAAAAEAWEQAAAHARRAGDEHERAFILCWVATSAWLGPLPVAAAIRRCERIREEVSGHLASEADVLRPLAALHAMAGRFDLARRLFASANTVYAELGLDLNAAISHPEAMAEMLAGEYAVAEARLRASFDAFDSMGAQALRATTAALLARAVLAQGRYGEAERFSELSEELAETRDVATQMTWRGVRARVLAMRGRFDEAERLAREAVSLAEPTDFVNFHADVLVDLAEVLEAAGRTAEAAAAGAEAVRLCERKRNDVAAARARARLDSLALA